MTNKEQGLRKRIGSDTLIGCYAIHNDGTTFFADIRGAEGNVVNNLNGDESDLEVFCACPSLKLGMFYSFYWHLDESQTKIVVEGTPELINNSVFLQGLFDARLRLSGSNLELFNNFQKTIFNEVTGAQHTYIYELLQNANDYPFKNEHVYVKFILTEHYLFFMHSGASFNLRNVVGISSINQGEKKKNIETIGYKGIGFKTVFINNDYVYLQSGDWSLRFDKAHSESVFAGECPWALMPIPTSINELDNEVLDTLRSNDMRVQFALRHRTDASKNIEQLDKVFSDNQILLFIPNVYKVDVIQYGTLRHSIEKDDKKWVVTDYSYTVPDDLKIWVEDNINSGNKIPEKFRDIKSVRISFAVGRDGNTLLPVENARVYNYLPTELRLGFRFLINADFVPNGSRNGLHDVEWNEHIMEQCGRQFADWWVSFLQKEGEFDLASVFELLPDFNSRDNYAVLFINGFRQRIKELPCIPTLRDGYHLVKLEDTIFDKIDFISCQSPILSDEEFYEFSDTTGYLPHPSIRTNSHLISLLSQFNLSIEFNNNHLSQLCFEEDFCRWLSIKSNNLNFISYLLRSEYIMNYWRYKIFLKEDGLLDKAESIYYDIDLFIDDISFLSDNLPRLNTEIRDSLTNSCISWAGCSSRFKKFNEAEFTKSIFNEFSKYLPLFSQLENSVNYIHFLSVNNSFSQIPENYPYFDQDGNMIFGVTDLYQSNEVGKELSKRPWIIKDWINFIHDDYLKRDEDKVKSFLDKTCKIKTLTQSDCFRLFISKDDRIPIIAEQIKDIDRNVDFFQYLSKIQESISNLSSVQRQNFNILTTDGRKEQWHPICKTIFWKDSEWESTSNAAWMPSGCCLAISDVYFNAISGTKAEKLREFFSIKQIVQRYSVAGLYQSLRSHMKEVFSQINTKEISKEFLNWIFLNRFQIFKDGQIDSQFKSIPILCKDSKFMCTIESLSDGIYLPNSEALELYGQSWFNQADISICDESYSDLFDGSERCEFFVSLGLKKFEKNHYLRVHLLKHLDKIKNNLFDRTKNISFHRYLSDIHDSISEKDMETVKEMPIFISTPDNENGISVDKSTDHYLPSDLLTDIISKDLVPLSILDSIHPDYIKSEKDIKYFTEKLGNVVIDEDGFYGYIIQDGISSKVKLYLEDKKRNISFWRWIADSKISKEKKAKLSIFPMFARGVNDSEDRLEFPTSLYISSKYSKKEDLEIFINEHINNPLFVSEIYWEENIERDWIPLFRVLKVTVDIKEIVFKHILPNLSNYKTISVVGILSDYREVFESKLHEGDSTISEYLRQLQLLCDDEEYHHPEDIMISGQYFDVDLNPFPEISIDNLLSEEYLSRYDYDSSKRREILKFITLIADTFCEKCENLTQLRNAKLKYFLLHQDLYEDKDEHFNIIGQLADSFDIDPEGIRDTLNGSGLVKIYTTTGKFLPATGMYLSTIYDPECQFMANGITELNYVSEKYAIFSSHIRKLFRHLNIHDYFSYHNIELLKNEQFAAYFWEVYAPKNEYSLKNILVEESLRDVPCIPTTGGIRRPCEVYDYRIDQLQKIVLKLSYGKDKLPGVIIPNWVDKIGFRGRLYLLDCLEYLCLDTIDYRKDVLRWITETKDEILNRYKNEIANYSNKANWLNGNKQWVPLNELVALEWGNKTLRDNFGGNAFICNPSYMPESQQAYNMLCGLFGIKILTNNDFTKKKEGECRNDETAKSEISKRLLYLAYKTDKENWQEVYNDYRTKLYRADVATCERIVYFYNDDIKKNLRIYAEEPEKLWYLGSWKGSMFLAVLDWIKKTFELKGDFDINYLSDLFLNPFEQFIKSEEGGTLPLEILNCLEEKEREGIEIDELSDAEAFEEERMNDNRLPNDHIRDAAQERQNRTMQHLTSMDGDGHNQYAEGKSINDSERTSSSSAVYGHGQSYNRTQGNSNGECSRVEQSQEKLENKGVFENTVSQSKASLQARLSQKWQIQNNAPIDKPRTNKTDQSHNYVFKPKDTLPQKDKDEFFDKSVHVNTRNGNIPASTGVSRDTYSNKYKAALEEVDKIKDQESLQELFANTPKYTFLWFKYLMEMLFNEKNNTATHRSVQIDFKDAFVIDKYTLSIIGPNRVVPKWIEYADSFEIYILNGTTPKKLDVELQYFTEDGIWVYTDKAEELENEINSSDKIRMIASGNIANHIDSLTKQFIKLGYDDNYNLKDNLPQFVKFIYGPPGTGKTTRLVMTINEIITSTTTNLDILVLTPTNKAADVIADRLSKIEKCDPITYRYGITDSIDYLKNNNVFSRNDEFISSDENHIVITTAARYAYDYLMPHEEIICDHEWNYIIVDEASMIDIITITFILHKGHNSRFIISGDPKQIQPVRQNDIQPENIYQMVGLNSFAAAQYRDNVEALKIQYRSLPSIGNLVSNYSYDGIVTANRIETDRRPLEIGFKISSLNFIGFKIESLDNLYGLDSIDDSAFHLYSAIFAYEFASYVAQKILRQYNDSPYSIGIVCPYKKQADAIRQMIELRDISNDMCTINCGTVHSFQGDECDIMFLVLNPPVNVGQNSHVNNQNIINVAISRARDYVFFLVPDCRIPGFYTREVLGKLAEHLTIQYCPDIEEIIFNDKEYIRNNTNVSCHTPVNVYFDSTSLYEVRKDDTAVDIQINEQYRPKDKDNPILGR